MAPPHILTTGTHARNLHSHKDSKRIKLYWKWCTHYRRVVYVNCCYALGPLKRTQRIFEWPRPVLSAKAFLVVFFFFCILFEKVAHTHTHTSTQNGLRSHRRKRTGREMKGEKTKHKIKKKRRPALWKWKKGVAIVSANKSESEKRRWDLFDQMARTVILLGCAFSKPIKGIYLYNIMRTKILSIGNVIKHG